ncbi:hypothetical protein RS130_20965 [Paraglaciecola aquimarina]|uniref:GCN5-related N-acetyltransferase n=1 Tax=Paraglaciecola aquimarina TaxID=1235557 RepID=A0ABU3T179_9ALTE|nr:hypothetical protein [Paraglaciecola aquimarina]MDU0356029.1 hypothetical protein [Paraglaciecola aquimarina]
MQIEVIQADYHNPKHASDLTQLLNAYANDPMGGGQPLAHTTQTHLIAELAKRSHVFSIICYVDQQPAGIVNCVEGFSTFACKPLINIHDLAVSQEFRG